MRKREKKMENQEYPDKWQLPHHYVCQLCAEAGMVWFGFSLIMTVVSMIQLFRLPAGEIVLENAGYAYEFSSMGGIVRCGMQYLPMYGEIVSNKAFCEAFLGLSILVRDIPYLVLLAYLVKLLKTIRSSHSPFVAKTTKYARRAGILMVLMGFLQKLVMQTGMAAIAYHTFYMNNPFVPQWILAGVIVLLMSDIFERGCELQQFSDETL